MIDISTTLLLREAKLAQAHTHTHTHRHTQNHRNVCVRACVELTYHVLILILSCESTRIYLTIQITVVILRAAGLKFFIFPRYDIYIRYLLIIFSSKYRIRDSIFAIVRGLRVGRFVVRIPEESKIFLRCNSRPDRMCGQPPFCSMSTSIFFYPRG